MKSVDHDFYASMAWRKVRKNYILKHGLCERCLKRGIFEPAVIVHHRKHLNMENLRDPRVAYDERNLESLCRKCHNAEHLGNKRRYSFGIDGSLIT